jgi:hypothetical protein
MSLSPNLERQPQGNFYRERERERASVQHCQIKQDFRVAKQALKFIKVRWGRGGGGGADTCKAWVAQLVIHKRRPLGFKFWIQSFCFFGLNLVNLSKVQPLSGHEVLRHSALRRQPLSILQTRCRLLL